jgi:hypothetical protein
LKTFLCHLTLKLLRLFLYVLDVFEYVTKQKDILGDMVLFDSETPPHAIKERFGHLSVSVSVPPNARVITFIGDHIGR